MCTLLHKIIPDQLKTGFGEAKDHSVLRLRMESLAEFFFQFVAHPQ
jgi:hypothetical protein